MTTPRWTSRPNRRRVARPVGFTLTELLVVMAIMIVLVSVGVPSIEAMLNSGRVQNATRSVGAAVGAARAYATRDRTFLMGDYSGAAVMVLPTAGLMYVENIEEATDGNGTPLETRSAPLNGYAQVAGTDVLGLPPSVGVVGIIRNSPGGGGVNLITPPFAVRFDEGGTLIAGQTGDRQVIYDFDRNGRYEHTKTRPNGYDPDTVVELAEVPFEAVETVIAAVVFDRAAFDSAGHDLTASGSSGAIDTAARNWIFQNGRVLMFNRYTGSVVNP